MASVTQRIQQITKTQPYGGYVPREMFTITKLNDGIVLNEHENVNPGVIGLAVEYLTRFLTGTPKEKAFNVSLQGAEIAELFFKSFERRMTAKRIKFHVFKLLKGIKGLNAESVVNACKLVTFDVWRRYPYKAIRLVMDKRDYRYINPDSDTIQNIQTMLIRSMNFFDKYGPVTASGFDFSPPDASADRLKEWEKTTTGTYGGYTHTVDSGDGDFLTADTLWDFKTIRHEIDKNVTLQLLMYWMMGKRSGQKIFDKVLKIGVFNPRLNKVYQLDVADIAPLTLIKVDSEIIKYPDILFSYFTSFN